MPGQRDDMATRSGSRPRPSCSSHGNPIVLSVAIAALAALVATAGCLGTDARPTQEMTPGEEEDPAPGPESPQVGSPGGPGGSASTDDAREADDTGRYRTTTASEGDESSSTLPGNLTMDGAEVRSRNATSVTFVWNDSLEPQAGEPPVVASTSFDVPADVPLWVNVTLNWSAATKMDVVLENRGRATYCSSFAPVFETSGPQDCGIRTFARSSWDRWDVTVKNSEFGLADTPTRPAPFTVTLTIRVAEPWTRPPLEAPQPEPNASVDPGWPALEDAEIRPGAKVGFGIAGVNFGTLNFVFSSPDNRTLYVGWVSHGVIGMEPGDTIQLRGVDAEATLVYCSWGLIEETVSCPDLELNPERREFEDHHPRLFNDFALFRIPSEVRSTVHPATMFWGGPNGLGSAPAEGTPLVAFGNTPARDGGLVGVNPIDPKRGVTTQSSTRAFGAHIMPHSVFGDSGSPVQTASGRAVGTISAIMTPGYTGSVSEPRPAPDEGSTNVTNLAHALDVMESQTALDVELETWSTFATPRARDLVGTPEPPGGPTGGRGS